MTLGPAKHEKVAIFRRKIQENTLSLTNTFTSGSNVSSNRTKSVVYEIIHPENWGLLVDNKTNEYISLYPVMDFNQCFLSYDNIDGANCQTVYPRRITQREAAIEAVQKIGLPQINAMDMSAFGDMKEEAKMFQLRLNELLCWVKKRNKNKQKET